MLLFYFPYVTAPVGPVAPAVPVAPVAPVAPVGPVRPVRPVGPVGPVGPVWHLQPELLRTSTVSAVRQISTFAHMHGQHPHTLHLL